MTDSTSSVPPADPTNLNRTAKAAIALAALTFNAGVIVFALAGGDPKNSLHTSALAWAFGSALAILAGLGFPSALDGLGKIGK